MMTYNLSHYIPPEIKVFSGRERGYKIRSKMRLDEIDTVDDNITIIIPEYIYSVNIGFFLALFGDSIRKLGVTKFIDKFIFVCDVHIMDDINDFIFIAIRGAVRR